MNEMNVLIELGTKYHAADLAHEEAKKVAAEKKEALDAAESEFMEAMIEAGCKSIGIEGIGRLTLRREAYPSVNAANKPHFYQYLRESGNGSLLKEDVHDKTLKSFLKKHIEELKKQFQDKGINEYQAARLCTYEVKAFDEASGMLIGTEYPYQDIAKAIGKPVDEMAADEIAIAFIKATGAAMFEKKGVALTK